MKIFNQPKIKEVSQKDKSKPKIVAKKSTTRTIALGFALIILAGTFFADTAGSDTVRAGEFVKFLVYGNFCNVCYGTCSSRHLSELDIVWAVGNSWHDTGWRTGVYDNRRIYFSFVKTPYWTAGAGNAS